jgi:hypothetical protein
VLAVAWRMQDSSREDREHGSRLDRYDTQQYLQNKGYFMAVESKQPRLVRLDCHAHVAGRRKG